MSHRFAKTQRFSWLWVALCLLFALLLPPLFLRVWGVHLLGMVGIGLVLQWVRPALRRTWFTPRPWEAPLYAALRIQHFQRLLQVTGWNEVVRQWRHFSGRHDLATLDQHTRRSEVTHLGTALLGLGWAISALFQKNWGVVAANVFLLVALHFYPIALQRQLRARIGRLPR